MPVAPRIQSSPSNRQGAQGGSRIANIMRSLNYPVVLATVILVSYGLLIVWSATRDSYLYSFNRQLMGVGAGLVLMLVIWRFDYSRLSNLTFVFLGLCVLLNIMPLLPVIGMEVNGGRNWAVLFGQQFQPAELGKIPHILFAAALMARYKGRLDSGSEYLKCFSLLMVPVISVLLQPDLGTAMVFFVVSMAVLFAGGANRRWLFFTVIMMIAAFIGLLVLDGILDNMLGRDVLIKDYQKDRLLVFLDPEHDLSGAGYQLRQAQIAIGSGGLFGKGLGNATQSALGFLPEAPTDFIICVLAEEFGFVGSVGLILLYAVLMFLLLHVAFNSYDFFGTLIITGILGMWIFQILENIGMNLGLMPITGIPLPFMSYGTSFMLVNFVSLGLVLSIWAHRKPVRGGAVQPSRIA